MKLEPTEQILTKVAAAIVEDQPTEDIVNLVTGWALEAAAKEAEAVALGYYNAETVCADIAERIRDLKR